MIDYKVVLKSVSSKLEEEIKENKIKSSEIADFIGMSPENFSKVRNQIKVGKIPSSKFLIGISMYFKKNFLDIPNV
ncbi:MAG: hypothetical protein ACRCU6_12525 [Fusobacteriaceae bacterium]